MSEVVGDLTPTETNIMKTLKSWGYAFTILRETGRGDDEELREPTPAFGFDPVSNPDFGVSHVEVVKGLHALEERGLVVSKHRVHPYDSSEYAYRWTPADEVSQQLDA